MIRGHTLSSAPQCGIDRRLHRADITIRMASNRPFQAHRTRREVPAPPRAEQQPEQKPKSSKPREPSIYRAPSKEGASLRAEAEAPFRSLRIVGFGTLAASATLATLFSLPTLIGALGGAPNAKPLIEALQDLAINVGALGTFGFLLKRDLEAREKQINRLMREDLLGACQLELANGRVLRLAQLRGFARAVLVAGSADQVTEALAAAAPYREALEARGVLVVPLPIYAAGGALTSSSDDQDLPAPGPEELRWRASAIRLGDWKAWFDVQSSAAGKGVGRGLYVSLRMDGRVRASGLGCPPWGVFAAQLPPSEGGFFSGVLDGMDGRV
jgi:hypothetical protein